MYKDKLTNIVKQIYEKSGVAVSIYQDGDVLVCSSRQVLRPSDDGVSVVEFFHYDKRYTMVANTMDSANISLLTMLLSNQSTSDKDTTFSQVLRGERQFDKTLRYPDVGDLSRGYTVFLIKTSDDSGDDVNTYIRSMASFSNDVYIIINEEFSLYLKRADIDEYDVTPKEFANLIVDDINREFAKKCLVSVGYTVHSYLECIDAVSYCKIAFEDVITSSSFKLVVTTAEFLGRNIFRDCPEIRGVLNKYLTSGILAVINDNTLNNTALTFIANSLNFSQTARDMYIHRNTLIARIRKIEKICGLDIKNFGEAMSYLLIFDAIRTMKESK
ncbi:MAG: helix-turn-helix domain-containing protein [Clostridia bacterium]|nr:helix-turn-helix domain-containing protein [Clostridia bacterium]